MEILIEDKGRSFDIETALADGRGLSWMRERVRLLGGELTFDSAPGQGTRLNVKIPLGGEGSKAVSSEADG